MSGSEGGVYFLSRSELLAWVNNLLQLSYTKVEECCSGPRNRTQHTATGPPPPPPRLCKAAAQQPCLVSTSQRNVDVSFTPFSDPNDKNHTQFSAHTAQILSSAITRLQISMKPSKSPLML